ncbi:MAG: hypothetical protein Q9188_004084 [Gyalolechia gomerana]
MSSSHGHSSHRHSASSSASRQPTSSNRSQAHRGMETVPEYEPLPKSRPSQRSDYQSTRLSATEGQELLVRTSTHKHSTHASRPNDHEDEDLRGSSRREVSYSAGGVPTTKHRSEVGRGESSSKSRTQVPYNDEPSRRRTVVQPPYAENHRQYEGPRGKTVYEEERASTRDSRAVTPYEKERTVTRKTHATSPYEEERMVTRNSRAVIPRVQTIRDEERTMTRTRRSSSSSRSSRPSNSELGRRGDRFKDENTRRIERDVESLEENIARWQMDKKHMHTKDR